MTGWKRLLLPNLLSLLLRLHLRLLPLLLLLLLLMPGEAQLRVLQTGRPRRQLRPLPLAAKTGRRAPVHLLAKSVSLSAALAPEPAPALNRHLA